MNVLKKSRAVVRAHKLPEEMDQDTIDFGAQNSLDVTYRTDGSIAVILLQGGGDNPRCSGGKPGDWIVLDGGLRLIAPDAFVVEYDVEWGGIG